MTALKLQDDFPETNREMWRALAEKGLRDEAFETLISRTEDGLINGPLFDESDRPDGHGPLPRIETPKLEGRAWHICAPILDTDIAHANTQLLEDLTGGCSAIYVMAGKPARRADLRRLFEGVHLDLVPLLFFPGHDGAAFAPMMEDLNDATVLLGLDPLAERPDIPENWRAFVVDAASVHEQGGTDVMELAVFCAILAESFCRHGKSVHDHLSGLFSAGTDAHLSLVKIRVARRLHARITEAFGIEKPHLPIQAITSLRMMQSEDAWTNLLRTNSATFGAVVGGADYVIVQPFTETPADRRLGKATSFAHRIARNQQLMMMEESHLGQVKDAAFGSYFHERLSEDMAQAAWTKFQAIEAAGGIEAYRTSGDFEADMETARQKRAEKEDPILGVTLHPAPDVRKPEVR